MIGVAKTAGALPVISEADYEPILANGPTRGNRARCVVVARDFHRASRGQGRDASEFGCDAAASPARRPSRRFQEVEEKTADEEVTRGPLALKPRESVSAQRRRGSRGPSAATIARIWKECGGDHAALRAELERRLRGDGLMPRERPNDSQVVIGSGPID